VRWINPRLRRAHARWARPNSRARLRKGLGRGPASSSDSGDHASCCSDGAPRRESSAENAGAARRPADVVAGAQVDDPRRRPLGDRRPRAWRAPRFDDIVILVPSRLGRCLRSSTPLRGRRCSISAKPSQLVFDTQEVREPLLALGSHRRSFVEAAGGGPDEIASWRRCGHPLRCGLPARVARSSSLLEDGGITASVHRPRCPVTSGCRTAFSTISSMFHDERLWLGAERAPRTRFMRERRCLRVGG